MVPFFIQHEEEFLIMVQVVDLSRLVSTVIKAGWSTQTVRGAARKEKKKSPV